MPGKLNFSSIYVIFILVDFAAAVVIVVVVVVVVVVIVVVVVDDDDDRDVIIAVTESTVTFEITILENFKSCIVAIVIPNIFVVFLPQLFLLIILSLLF